MSNSLDPDQARQNVVPDLGPNCLQRLSTDNTCRKRVYMFYADNPVFVLCVIQGWLKCEDTACGARIQKLPLMFQRGHPVCSSCHKGILHPEVCFFYIGPDKQECKMSRDT